MLPALNSSKVAETARICFHESVIHGTGGFAKMDIAAGTRVIEYVGEKITKAESLRRCEAGNEFIFSLDDTHDLDGNVLGNLARFLNHSCYPNCDAEPDGGRVWIVARRGIRAGEEITFNYGYELEDYREHPCRCGADECAGYIVAEEFFDHVKWQGEVASEAGQEASRNS
jgi:SET domain-containing protein